MDVSQLTVESLRRKNFTPNEFLASKKAKELEIKNQPNLNQLTCGMKLADKMQELRDAINKPFIIDSGFRNRALNKAVGGSPDSQHIAIFSV